MMPYGKSICEVLKEIRRQIAAANDIEFQTSECQYKGDCRGTCPKCESEIRYLENQIATRRLAGKAIVIAGISAMIGACSNPQKLAAESRNEVFQNDTDSSPRLNDDVVYTPYLPPKHDEDSAMESVGPRPTRQYHPFAVSAMPQWPGGEEKLIEWIESRLVYPEGIKKEDNVSILVRFVVQADGTVVDVVPSYSAKTYRIEGPRLYEKEVARVMKLLPKFLPGKVHGKPANVICTETVEFRLNGNNGTKPVEVDNSLEPECIERRGRVSPGEVLDEDDFFVERDPDPDKIYDIVDKKPEFPGGESALLKWVATNIVYPSELGCSSYSTKRVVVQFVVMKNGEIGEIRVVRSAGEIFDNMVVDVVKRLPKFSPGEMNNKPVNVWYTLPVLFKDKNYEETE